LEYLAETAEMVNRERNDIIFAMAGGAPGYAGKGGAAYYERIRSQLGSSRFRFLGPIPHYQLPQLYSMASVFVFPTLYEGFPKAMLEAMACEKPVVSTNVGGIPEMIESGIEGLLVEMRRPREFAEAIIEIMSDEARARRMGRMGRRKIEKNFTWNDTARTLHEVYERTKEIERV
jgi:glycosyltransferase involved in cell wall biosynthesis